MVRGSASRSKPPPSPSPFLPPRLRGGSWWDPASASSVTHPVSVIPTRPRGACHRAGRRPDPLARPPSPKTGREKGISLRRHERAGRDQPGRNVSAIERVEHHPQHIAFEFKRLEDERLLLRRS